MDFFSRFLRKSGFYQAGLFQVKFKSSSSQVQVQVKFKSSSSQVQVKFKSSSSLATRSRTKFNFSLVFLSNDHEGMPKSQRRNCDLFFVKKCSFNLSQKCINGEVMNAKYFLPKKHDVCSFA